MFLIGLPRLGRNGSVQQIASERIGRLSEYREDVNYRHYFTDPDYHECLNTGEERIAKRIRTYRDDTSFFYPICVII